MGKVYAWFPNTPPPQWDRRRQHRNRCEPLAHTTHHPQKTPSRFPSSQTHEAAETDLHVTAIESVLAKLSEAERAAIIKHIIKLANMSRKQRAAIMALTDGD